jgi:hypothetical protein
LVCDAEDEDFLSLKVPLEKKQQFRHNQYLISKISKEGFGMPEFKKMALFCTVILSITLAGWAQPLVVDHNSAAAFHTIPDYWIQKAKDQLHIAYQHT